MPDDQARPVRAKRFDEEDKGNDDEDGQEQIAPCGHPGYHGNEHRMQGEEECQQQREQPLVTQSAQEPENAEAAHDVQDQIGKMVDKRTRPSNEGVEHETDRLQRTVKAAVGP